LEHLLQGLYGADASATGSCKFRTEQILSAQNFDCPP